MIVMMLLKMEVVVKMVVLVTITIAVNTERPPS